MGINKEVEEVIKYLDREFYEFQSYLSFLKKIEKRKLDPDMVRFRTRRLIKKIRGIFGLERIERKENEVFNHFKKQYKKTISHSKDLLEERLVKQAEVFNNFLIQISSRKGQLETDLANLATKPNKTNLVKVMRLLEESIEKVIGFREVMREIEAEEERRFEKFNWLTAKPKEMVLFFETLDASKEKLALAQIKKRKDAHIQKQFSKNVIRLRDGNYILPKNIASRYVIGFHTTCETIARRILKQGFRCGTRDRVDFHPIKSVGIQMQARMQSYGFNGCVKVVNNLMEALFSSKKRKLIENDASALKAEITKLLKIIEIDFTQTPLITGTGGLVPKDLISFPGLRAQTIEAIMPIKQLTRDSTTGRVKDGEVSGYELHLKGNLPRKFILYLHKPFVALNDALTLPPTQKILKKFSDYKELTPELRKELGKFK